MQVARVVYATDFSRCAAQALPQAVRLADAFGAELHVLHAVVMLADDPHDPAAHLADAAAVAERLRALAAEKMAGAVAAAAAPALDVRQVQERGVSASGVILDYAAEIGADLIVLGTHGRRGVGHLFLGSVAEDVVRRASCAVLTVRERADEPATWRVAAVLVPVDFGPTALATVRAARELAARFGASLRLLHVVEVPVVPQFYFEGRVIEPIDTAELRGRAVRQLEALAGEAGGPAVRTEAEAVEGRPWQGIVEYAARAAADLIVMSGEGLGSLGEMLLGSVTERVVRGAACPVLTLKERGGRMR
jgi:nucleotide-binding universal stress UspA family protein